MNKYFSKNKIDSYPTLVLIKIPFQHLKDFRERITLTFKSN